MTNVFQIAEAAKLKPLELELKKLEDLSDAIVQDFALMRKREEEMRDTNGELGKFSRFLSFSRLFNNFSRKSIILLKIPVFY